jgi:NADH:ubiquinone oxidoreductase subunit F (NADH-binding)
MKPEEIVEEVKKSQLRGLGGAGFSAGVKWEACRRSEGEPKYLIANGDEGDPGAFMDRAILESDPHSVLEGMIIAGLPSGLPWVSLCPRGISLAVRGFRTPFVKQRNINFWKIS